MQIKRWNTEMNREELVESIGRVRFIGSAPGYDLTNGKIYDCIGIRNHLLMLIDDTKDYYLYLPQDGNRILAKKAQGAGFIIVDDPTGQLKSLFAIQHEKRLKQQKKLGSRLIQKIIEHNKK